ncbi:MAG: redoxin domain-containing protein [Candidatus Poribacteria bacterium]|nr:redoxin domain-containing protein [Candidatus Poribacteria bacterium]MDE0506742.1 redoxin domain-containing protein [Candidatus Poribacteria bacterium]
MNLRSARSCRQLVPVVCILAIVMCVTIVYAGSVPPAFKYQEIKRLHKKMLRGSGSGDLDVLIDKAAAFVTEHSDYKRAAQIHYILGGALSRADRTEEAVQTYERLTKDYPDGSFPGEVWLKLGLAYDKLGRHDEANGVYQRLIDHPKHGSSSFANTAKRTLAMDRTSRKGEMPSNRFQMGNPDELVGKPAIEFHVKDVNGGDLSLEKHRGKVVLLDFWAVWCGPCRAETPHLKRAYEEFKNREFEIIGSSLDHNESELLAYIEEQEMTWPQFLNETGENDIAQKYNVMAIPQAFLIDHEGVIRKANLRGHALEPAIAELLKERDAKLGAAINPVK